MPSLIGYSSVTSNIGEINNKGIELSLHSTNINKPNLTWRTTLNLSYNKNTIKHLYGIMEDIKDGRCGMELGAGEEVEERERSEKGWGLELAEGQEVTEGLGGTPVERGPRRD